jgi:hypothetical protein
VHRKKGGLVVGGLGLLPAGSGSGFLFSGSVVFVVVADAHIACWKGTCGFTLLHMQLQLGKQKNKMQVPFGAGFEMEIDVTLPDLLMLLDLTCRQHHLA